MAAESGFLRRKEVPGVQCGIAMEFPDGAMKRIGSGLRCDHDLASGLPAVLGRVCSRQNLEFADGIQDRPVQRLVRRFIVVVDTIENVLIGDFAIAGNVQTSAKPQIRSLRSCEHVRLHEGELQVVASVQRQFNDFPLVDDVS